MQAYLADFVAQYDTLRSDIALVRLGLRAIDSPPADTLTRASRHTANGRRKILRGDAARQLRRLRRELELLRARQREAHAAMVACAATIPAFAQLQRTFGIGPVRAAHLLISCIAPASRAGAVVPTHRCGRRIDAFEEKRQLG